ncbi:MAG: metal-dependent hydrolase [Romboutsia sp.]|uniref:metal-dependent hydrolase n=1 Tax=Romboutsia sp. TaxID=1965302 RepID=UPI003F4159D7
MVKETHIKGGYVFALLAIPFLNDTFLSDYNLTYKCILIIIYTYFAHLGSLSPDIDMRGSYISKRYPNIHKKLGSKFKHRGFTHSILFVSFIAFLSEMLVLYTNDNIVFICLCSGFFVGYISHLLLDLMTKEGIEVFYPVSINFSLLPIKTNSKTEKFICKFLNFIVIFLLGYRFYVLL